MQDTQGAYNAYSIPGSGSPYPRDYIIDQQGNLVYMNSEYDAQAMRLIVASLLETPVKPKVELPASFLGLKAWPNPFNGPIRIQMDLETGQAYSLELFNLRGQLIAGLSKGVATSPREEFQLDSAGLASGIYFLTLKQEGSQRSLKILLTK